MTQEERTLWRHRAPHAQVAVAFALTATVMLAAGTLLLLAITAWAAAVGLPAWLPWAAATTIGVAYAVKAGPAAGEEGWTVHVLAGLLVGTDRPLVLRVLVALLVSAPLVVGVAVAVVVSLIASIA